jgi:hypothetical protein
VFGGVAVGDEQGGQGRWQLGIDDEVHVLAGEEDGMVSFGGGVVEAGGDVFGLEVGVVLEDFGFGDFGGEEVEDVFDADAHAANAGAASALVGVEGDAVGHGMRVAGVVRRVK